jgi:hypothetical protein
MLRDPRSGFGPKLAPWCPEDVQVTFKDLAGGRVLMFLPHGEKTREAELLARSKHG